MSGFNPIKAIKKVFKAVGKAVKTVVKAIKPIAKVVLVAAAVYFTVGTATAFFAAPQAGLGAAMSSTASSMWTGVTSAFNSVTSAFSGAAPAASSAATTAGASVGPTVLNASPATALGNFASAAAPAAQTATTATGGGGLIGGLIDKGIGAAKWVGQNQGAAYLLGKGIEGGMAAKEADIARKREDQLRREQGFFGMDQVGNKINLPTTSGGIINNAMAAPAVQAPQTQTQVAQQGAQGQQVAAAEPDPYAMTPAQFLEYQRMKLIPTPYGSA